MTDSARGPVVELSDLSLAYPHRGRAEEFRAVSGVSLTLAAGEVLGVLGEAGSGKSTLARLLSARSPDRGERVASIVGGEARVLGHRLDRLGRRDRNRLTFRIGYLAQDAHAALPPGFTVRETVASPLTERDRRFDEREALDRVVAVLDAVQLDLAVLERFPYELSKGERQRVALARALVLGPRLVIADDPIAGIDPTVRHAVLDVVTRLHRRGDVSAIVVSHDPAVVDTLVDRIAVLHEGRLVGLGPPREVLDDPRHPYVERLAATLDDPVPASRADEEDAPGSDGRDPDGQDGEPAGRRGASAFPAGPDGDDDDEERT